jgi:hypothetical protein
LIVVSVVRVGGRCLGVRIHDTIDGSSVILYPHQVRWLCARRLLDESVCGQALQALRRASG